MAEKLKVTIVAPANSPGGQAAQAAFLIRHWSNDPDVDARLVASDPPLPIVFRMFEGIPYARTLLRLFIYIGAIWRGLKGVDVVHIFSASYWAFILVPVPAFATARARKARVVLHYHSGEAADHLKHWRSAHWLLRRVDRVVLPSGYLQGVFAAHGFSAVVIPNGIDDAQFVFRSREVLQPRMVCTRSLEPYYRIDLIIRAFAAVKSQFPAATLTLVGSGSEEQSLRDLVAQLRVPDVHFAGAVQNSEIDRFYDIADIWLNASVIDNMPVSLLEAFAAGSVVISTSTGGIPYIVEDGVTGLLSKPEDVDGMVANILRVLQTPGLGAKLSQAAFNSSLQYRWPRLRPKWAELYAQLARDGADDGVDIAFRAAPAK